MGLTMANHGLMTMVDNGPFLKSMVNHGHDDHAQPWLTVVHFSKAWSTMVMMTMGNHG